MATWRYRHHGHTFQLFCLHRSARTPSLRANVQGAHNQGIWCGLATIFMAALLGLPGQPMYWRTVEVQSLMLLPCGPRIVVGLLVELVGDPLLSPHRRSHESSRVPSSADGGWRGPFAGSQPRLPTLDRRQLRSQSQPPSVFLAKPQVSPVNHPFAPDLLSPRRRHPIRLIASRPRNERKEVFPCPWVVLAAAVPVLRHRRVLSVMGALGILVSQDLAEPRERIRCVGLSKHMALFLLLLSHCATVQSTPKQNH